MPESLRTVLRTAAAALLLCVTLPGFARAQAEGGAGTTRLMVTTYHLKPELIVAWEALQKAEVVPALRKAGVKSRSVFHTVVGDTTEFQIVEPISGFDIFDRPDPLVRVLGKRKAEDLKARLAQCVNSVQRQMQNRVNEFFIDPGDAPVQFASKYRAMPGKSFAYTTFYRTYMQPVLEKAKANGTFEGMDYTVSGHGGEWGLITLNMYYKDFAPLDGEPPVAKTLGPEGTRDLLSKGQGLVTPLEWIVRKRVPDLSF